MYHGFYTYRGRKFPHGNFRTSVFCGAKRRQNTLVGETVVSRQLATAYLVSFAPFIGVWARVIVPDGMAWRDI